MITKELLIREIDRLDAGYWEVLYKIIKAFEPPIKAHGGKSEWLQFINETYGCLADNPIERGEQRTYELREDFR
jgi:hypothetical protein